MRTQYNRRHSPDKGSGVAMRAPGEVQAGRGVREGPIRLWNPSGFDPSTCIGEPLRNRADLARFLLHKIVWGRVFRRENESGFVRLKSAYLRKFFPDDQVYKRVMGGLIGGGSILCDGRYIEGSKCLGYKLDPELSRTRHARITVTDPILAGKIARSRAEHSRSLRPVHGHLLGHLRSVWIDLDAAIEAIQGGGHDPINATAARIIAAGDFHLSVCDYGRVHTNLTNLKSDLRKHLRVDGEPLVNLDIRNSQPLVFAALLKEHFGSKAGRIPADVLRYVELVQAGTFYDHLMAEAGIDPTKRDAFKRNLFARIFFCKSDPATTEARAFGDCFPGVYRVIRDLKSADYKALSHMLQRRESSLMIGGVASRCMEEIPHAFITTIHDSILCQPRHADAIRSIMLREFAAIGLIPTIQAENYPAVSPGKNRQTPPHHHTPTTHHPQITTHHPPTPSPSPYTIQKK